MTVEKTYWQNITGSTRSLLDGLKLTLSHLLKARKSRKPVAITNDHYFNNTDGINTIQYPYEMQPVPDTGRYRLHNEIDDCIVCDKCAKVCPVDCIDIEPIKAVEEFGKTSDGTSKRIYAARFDIDMGKCCFCGLCTTVCPTECLTMTKVYDFSTFDIREHNFVFGEMTEEEIAAKKKEQEEHQKSKLTLQKPAVSEEKKESASDAPKVNKPVFKPKIKPAGPASIYYMILASFIVYFFEALAALSAIGILLARNVFQGALLLFVCLLCIAGIYVLTFAEFIAVTQILVYAGGILVLIIFGIMLTSRISGKPLVVTNRYWFATLLVGGSSFVFFVNLFSKQGFSSQASLPEVSANTMQSIGVLLMSDFILPFEIAGILLLTALVGSAVMASLFESKKEDGSH